MSFDKILSDLQSGKISAEQAKELIRESLEEIRIPMHLTGESADCYQTGVDCCMIRLGLKEWEATI